MNDKKSLTSNMTTDDIIGAICVLDRYECVQNNPTKYMPGELPIPWITWDEGGDTYICVLRTYMPYEYTVYCEKNGVETDWNAIRTSFDRLKDILTQRLRERDMMDYDERMFAFDYESGFSFASVF